MPTSRPSTARSGHALSRHVPRRLIGAATATALILGLSSSVSAQALPSVYYDQGHGEMPPPPPMADLARRNGFTVHVGTGPIDGAVLAAHRMVYLRAPSKEITGPERDAVVAFVKGGGSLLLVLDEEGRQPLAVTKVNELLAAFGLSLTGDTPYLHNTGAIARAGEVTKADRELPYSGGRAVEGGSPFAWQLDAEGRQAQPFAAFAKVPGGGRVIVMAEGMASLFLGTPEGTRLTSGVRDPATTTYWGKDSMPFMADVFAWLLTR